MRILYPQNPLVSTEADGPYQAEYEAALAAGLNCSLFDFDALALGEFSLKGACEHQESVLYRGWMLSPEKYQLLVGLIRAKGGTPITSAIDYLKCHHLPEWYDDCRDLTATTHFFSKDTDVTSAATQLDWSQYFVKDYVKSNTGDKGSIARSPTEISEILEQLALYRGEIEGGIVLRQIEDYLPDTETRYFVANGTAYGATGEMSEKIPALVQEVTRRIKVPFYSVDVASTAEGALRLVELGDGQVSGLKNWSVINFNKVLFALC